LPLPLRSLVVRNCLHPADPRCTPPPLQTTALHTPLQLIRSPNSGLFFGTPLGGLRSVFRKNAFPYTQVSNPSLMASFFFSYGFWTIFLFSVPNVSDLPSLRPLLLVPSYECIARDFAFCLWPPTFFSFPWTRPSLFEKLIFFPCLSPEGPPSSPYPDSRS